MDSDRTQVLLLSVYYVGALTHVAFLTQFSGGAVQSPFSSIPLTFFVLTAYAVNSRKVLPFLWLFTAIPFWVFSVAETCAYSEIDPADGINSRAIATLFSLATSFGGAVIAFILVKSRKVGDNLTPPSDNEDSAEAGDD